MGRRGDGVEVRERSIRLAFVFDGKARKETIKTDGKPLAPTPANIKYAHRLAAEIRGKLLHDTFVYADYFPASAHSTSGHGTTVADQLDLWIKVQTGKASSTIKGYKSAVGWWKARIGHLTLRALKPSRILEALATEPEWTGKTRNNKTSVLRQALELAVLDKALAANPMDSIEHFEHQSPEPDPFALDEVEVILADLRSHYDAQIALYFEFKFFTGLRTSESLGLRWESIDWRRSTATIKEAIVLGEHETRTKTQRIREVHLNSRALAALKAMKQHTFLQKVGGWVFLDPRTSERYTDDEPPREMYWRPALKRIGIRYRSPYQTRHTYATIMLMSGATPAWAARQMGHSIEMFLRRYTKWIDGGQNAVEMKRIETLLSAADTPLAIPQKPGKGAK